MNLKQRECKIEYDEFDLIDDKILKIRGIDIDKKYDFITPSIKYLNNPFGMKNMDIAVEKYIDAIANDKRICHHGDPDCDGINSVSIASGYTSIFTENYITLCNQRKEGHGVKADMIPKDIELLIIVDSSTNEIEECRKLHERGVDIIILDHHLQ